METMERKPISSPDTKPEVSFRSSSSTTLNLSAPHYFSRPGVPAKDLFTHPGEWLKYRFTGEHLMGSIIQLLNMYSTFELMRNGLEKKDPSRIYGGASATALTGWGFLSARGARQPEGENFAQRFVDTIKHPEQCMIQLGWLGSFPINATFIIGDLYHGYKGQSAADRNLKQIGMSRLAQGGLNLSGSALIFSSLFKNQKANNNPPVTWKHSQSSHQSVGLHIKEVARFAFYYDKGGLLGRSLHLLGKSSKLYEAIKSIQMKRAGVTDDAAQGGGKLLRSAIVGLCVYLTQSYYEYSRLYYDAVNTRQPEPNNSFRKM